MRTPLDLAGFTDPGAGDGTQLFWPDLDDRGVPCLQPGEAIIAEFDTIAAGIRSGLSPIRHAGGSMDDLVGRCSITTTRAVFVCQQWWPGRAGTDCSKRVLVGQVRWPWLATLAFSRPSRLLDGLIEFRCVQSTEHHPGHNVFLALAFGADVDVDDVVHGIVDAVRRDRVGHPGFCPIEAAHLQQLQVPRARRRWTTLPLAGAYERMASTAANGGVSAATLEPWRDRLIDPLYV